MMLDRDMVDAQYMRVFHKDSGYQLELTPGTHQLDYSQSTGNPNSIRSGRIPLTLAVGKWYHFAAVNNNLQVTLYLNGQEQARFTAAGAPQTNSNPLILSGQTYGDGTMVCCGFPGSLRQFRIWNRALPAAEIPSVATKILSGTEAGLVAGWPLDDGQGIRLRDIGANRLTLQLSGPANFSPVWLRTAIADGDPIFEVRRVTLPARSILFPRTIPIDFDREGDLDLLACQSSFTTADALPCGAFRNDGKGNFSDVTERVLGPSPPRFETPRDYHVADFNGDGRADVFIANTGECPGCPYTGGQSALLLQTIDGRLQDATAAAGLPQARMFTHNVAGADVDGDGDVDLYYQNFFYQPPALFLNDGRGAFTPGEPGRLPPIWGSAQFPAITARFIDVNNDGDQDLYVGLNHGDNQPRDLLLLNDGHGFFTLAPDNALPNRYGGRNWGTVCIRVVDFDGDGWPDLINSVYGGPFYSEGAVQIMLNNRDGTFRDATDRIVQPVSHRHGSDVIYLDPVFPADFNGDGFMDLLVEGISEPSLLFLNTGPEGGGRLVEVSELLPDAARQFAVADFNDDRVPDIVAWIGDFLETWLTSRKFALTADLIPPVAKGPFFLRGGVLNSATFSADALAPGELVTIFGRNFGPGALEVATPASGRYPTEMAGTRVLFDGVAAPIIYAAAGQVSAVVPFSVLPESRADVVIEYQGLQSPSVSIYVDRSAPGLFTLDSSGAGPAAVLNVDAVSGSVSVNGPQNPAARGGYIVAYLTGAGETVPPSVDGVVADGVGQLALPVRAGLDFFDAAQPCDARSYCTPVDVLYSGPAPGIVAGVTQVNMRIPDIPSASGTHPLYISVGGIRSQALATVSIR
jgi:uncharacterized protein (TIGR03437 family)